MSRDSHLHPKLTVLLLGVVVGLGVWRRLWLGLSDHGIYWPDEIYQSLEPAHRLVYSYGLVAWEFVDGARNWALPGLIAAVLWVARVFGADEPSTYLAFVRVFFVLIAGATIVGVHRLARVLGAGPLASIAGAAVFAGAAPIVYFGHRAMSETASALPVVFGFALALDGAQRRSRGLLIAGASLLGVAVLLRLQNGVFCLGLLGILLARREWRIAGEAFGVLVVWALLFGLLDKLTWGGWYHSAFKYLQFNLIEGKAAQWGTSPFEYYGRVLWKAMPLVTALVGVTALLSVKKAPGLLLTAAAFFLLHSYTPHKELRFLIPMMPLVCALSAVGVQWVFEKIDATVANVAMGALALAAFISGARAPALTFGDLGAYESLKPGASAWNDFADVNRLLLAAYEQEDLCGIKVESAHQAWTGGFTYLHRDVPFYAHNGPPRGAGHYNYAITGAQPWMQPGTVTNGLRVVARDGRHALVQFAPTCVPDPGYTARLP